MVNEHKSQRLVKLSLTIALLLGLSSHQVFAQAPAATGMPTTDVVADFETAATAVSSAITATNAALQPLETAWSKAIDGANAYLQAKIASMNVDTASNNNRTNVNVQAAQNIALQNDLVGANQNPPLTLPNGQKLFYSSCRVAQAAAAGAELDAAGGGVAQAMASGGSPLDTAGTAAQNIQAGLDFGLDPCTNTKDTEYNVNKSLKCSPKWGGKFERADRSIAALYSAYQFPVPPAYTGPVNGVYQPLDPKKITEAKYMPFVAAYSACQHLQPNIPPAPSANGSNPTMGSLAKDAYKKAELKANAAVSECMSQLAERMQYGSDMTGAFKDLYTDQATICTADVVLGYLAQDPVYTFADGTSGNCQRYGRSQLQRMKDVTVRDQQSSYHSVYLVGADRHDILAENRQLQIEKQDFAAYIQHERQALDEAIQASDTAASTYTSSLSLSNK